MATGVDALASEGIFVAGNACLKEPMMFDLRDTCSFDEFDRNRREHLDGLRETGRPKVLKGEDGQEFVVQSAEAYRALLQRLEYAECVIGIQEGRASIARGEALPLDEAFEEIRRDVKRRFP